MVFNLIMILNNVLNHSKWVLKFIIKYKLFYNIEKNKDKLKETFFLVEDNKIYKIIAIYCKIIYNNKKLNCHLQNCN